MALGHLAECHFERRRRSLCSSPFATTEGWIAIQQEVPLLRLDDGDERARRPSTTTGGGYGFALVGRRVWFYAPHFLDERSLFFG
jgi:hypothetical protein